MEEEQTAFRPYGQTQNQIFSQKAIIEKTWDWGKSLYLAFLDIKAVFDSVPREEIWTALAARNVPTALVNVIKSTYHHDSKGVVRIHRRISEAVTVTQW